MHIALVHVHVKPDCIETFVAATNVNAASSRLEPGIVRFDVLQQQDDPARFILVEVYRTTEAVAAHKATAHYATWRETVAPLHGRTAGRRGLHQRLALGQRLVAMQFEFATATEIVFGAGIAATAGTRIARFGTKALVVTGATPGRASAIAQSMTEAGVQHVTYAVPHEPTLDDARRATALAREHGAELVVACGGGSAIDLGKAVAALLANPGDPLEYVEVIGRGRPIVNRSVPFVAVPTTAGHRGRGNEERGARRA